MTTTRERRYTVDIDIGGTLTDGLFGDGEKVHAVKVDTTPHDFTRCFFDCLHEGAKAMGHDDLTSFLAGVAVVRWSTTIATNVLAEGKGPRIGLLVSGGEGGRLYGDAPSAAVGGVVAPENVVEVSDDASDEELLTAIRSLLEQGVRRVCVSLRGAFEDGGRELAVKRLVNDSFPDHFLGAVPVLLGSEVCRHPDDQTRTHMALVNAYVHTPLAVALFKAEDELLGEYGYRRPVYIAHVNGGVARVAKTKGIDTTESSPYFGLSACAYFARRYGLDRVLALDVGGTTAKLGAVVDGELLTAPEGELFGIPLKTPWPLLRSAAVGGGSVARVQDGAVALGPESMGAFPGPACYDLGSARATLTDAFLVSGMLDPDGFLGGRRRLSVERATEALRRDVAEPLGVDVEEAARLVAERGVEIVVRTAEETLGVAGLDPSDFTLFCFGGNGGNFAAPTAERLGVRRAVVFQLGPVLSAFGSSVADVCHVMEAWPFLALDNGAADAVPALVEEMRATVLRDLEGEGLRTDDATVRAELGFGGGATVTTAPEPAALAAALAEAPAGARLEHVAVRGVVPTPRFDPATVVGTGGAAAATGRRQVRGAEASLYAWHDLQPDAVIAGPAVLESETNTCTIPPGWQVRADEFTNGVLERRAD
ncbi:MAG: N-methylhydantoinase [Solirubrobacteraceae bacterium]|jgi:acetophenone carboxylase|nr:N-methylhydantoinase [Solirubrobacteraceae bacterium]